MCGGHLHKSSPEGLTRAVRTYGEIEPCRLDVKAKAPIRRFAALKELVNTINKVVFDLKEKCPTLSGLYERSDAMLAIYPGAGARFAKHIDNTTQDGRRLTVLCYLNPEWENSLGGALRLFIPKKYQQHEESHSINSKDTAPVLESQDNSAENSKSPYHMKAVDVYPEGGRLAMFYSSEVPHEVLPTYGQRHSLTIWYYDTAERKQALERAKEGGKALQAAKTSIETQQSAQQFISQLMGGNEIPEDGGNPTQEELDGLCLRVTGLSDEVLELVSNITGAPSVQSFRDGFPLLTLNDLKQMRALFRRMGLGSYTLADDVRKET
jgi:hypoxia-inducible factor (prolyl hydroxylase)